MVLVQLLDLSAILLTSKDARRALKANRGWLLGWTLSLMLFGGYPLKAGHWQARCSPLVRDCHLGQRSRPFWLIHEPAPFLAHE